MFSSFFLFGIYLLKYTAFLLSYVSNTNAFPKPLSPKEEEKYLLLAYNGDNEAKNILIERNLRLVAHIAKKYASACENESEDLISIGTIGLIKAINSYNSDKPARLATYAARCIENEILMYIRASKKKQQDISLNDCLGHDSEGNEVTFLDILSTDEEDIADQVNLKINSSKLYDYIEKGLNEREKKIITLRYGLSGKPYTQREIAKHLGISRSYVSRIETKALKKLFALYENEE